MTKRFHYDYFSLRDVNVEKWSQDFFWPVPPETTTQITLDFKEEQCRIINELGHTFEGDCFLIGHLISNKFIQVVNHYLSVDRIQKAGYSIKHSEKLKFIPLLLKKNADIKFEHEDIWLLRSEYPKVRHLKSLVRSIQYNFKKNSCSIIDHFSSFKTIFAFSDENIIKRHYTLSQHKWVRLTSHGEWLDARLADPVTSYTKNIFVDISEKYVEFAKIYLRRTFGILLTENIAKALLAYTTKYLVHIAHVYSALQKKVKKIHPRYLFTPTAGQPFVRALSLAVRNEGGRVTGFPHGYYICHYSSPRPALHELATVDEFIAYTPGSVPLMERNLAINAPPRNNSVKILHENNPLLLEQWNSWKNKPLPKKIETVMVLELSLRTELAGYYIADSTANYHFYYRLCRWLSEHGYNVIFKKRPKSLDWEGINLFRDIKNLKVVNDLFEAPGVVEQADAIFIQYAMSSTLYWSMCTNKTVVYIDAGWEPWFPDVYELMAKRCRILHCWYDERNRQCFDKEELLNILETPPEPPNTEFLEKYLFPN